MQIGPIIHSELLGTVYTPGKVVMVLPWCVGAVALIAMIATPWRVVYTELKTVLFVVAVLALAGFGPVILADRIEVTPEAFSFRAGGWWHPNVHRFLLRDVARIEVVTLPGPQGKPYENMRVTFKRGGYEDVSIGDTFRAHKDEIFRALNAAITPAD